MAYIQESWCSSFWEYSCPLGVLTFSVSPLGALTSFGSTHVLWGYSCPLGVLTSSGNPHVLWESSRPLGVLTSSTGTHVFWEYSRPLGVLTSSGSTHVLWEYPNHSSPGAYLLKQPLQPVGSVRDFSPSGSLGF
ncbi:unnamed protein product [Nesidiocoris tenuis]|uniref:Uncharacterized protein n=1 Tax=Nesidiocoris tenuis TaxID=355587 RepID=A0A6H5HVY9_9HEMI|nr:unnamed protein product [Nesidiocoris tenuis]